MGNRSDNSMARGCGNLDQGNTHAGCSMHRMIAILVLACGSQGLDRAAAAEAESPATARIGVRDGRFVQQSSGKPFRPRGFNYIRLPEPMRRWHGTFAPPFYDARWAEAMLADLAGRGFNTVRVFIDHRAPNGVVASADAQRLSPEYMEHFLDFLARARRHGIYVVPALIHLPMNRRYRDVAGVAPEGIGQVNCCYLHQGHIDAKARYVADFVSAIRAHDSGLLPTILAYELDNETHYVADRPPFSLTEGTIRPANGKTYDLASEQDLQRMADDHVIRWANTCTAAIRRVDPEAMVSTNVFTFRAVGRSGPGKLRTDKSRDGRFPARPLALARSNLSYLDVHFYSAGDDEMFRRDLASIEFEAFRAACREAGKPLIMGEFGSFKGAQKTLPEATRAISELLRKVSDRGFVGFLYWTYDTDEQPYLWNGKSANGEILDALTKGTEHGD